MKKTFITLLTAVILILTAGISVYAEQSSATVKIVIEGTNGGTVTITRADGTTDGNCVNSLHVPAEGIDYTFTHDLPEGTEDYAVYDYNVKQTAYTQDAEKTYDESVYTARIYVGYSDGKRASSIMILDRNGEEEKPDKVSFKNKKKDPPEPPDPNDPQDPKDPPTSRTNTGDSNNIMLWALFILIDLMLIIVIGKSRKVKGDKQN